MTKQIKMAFKSRFILLIVIVFALELIARSSQASGLGYSARSGPVIQFENKLNHKSHCPVLLTGSSLFLYPAVRCDEELELKKPRYDARYLSEVVNTYSKAQLLENILSSKAGRSVHVANLASAGQLISDQYLVLRNWLDSGQRPTYVVMDISTREFQDNWQQDIYGTVVGRLLGLKFSVFDVIFSHIAGGELFRLPRVESVIYRQRSSNRASVEAMFASCLNQLSHRCDKLKSRPQLPTSNPSKFVEPAVASTYRLGGPERLSEELKYYKKTYWPFNMAMYKQQLYFLNAFLRLANEYNITVVMMVMPLPSENMDLLTPSFRKMFVSDVKEIAAARHVRCAVASELSEYIPTDYEDCAHLNAKGGRKLFSSIADCIDINGLHSNYDAIEKSR